MAYSTTRDLIADGLVNIYNLGLWQYGDYWAQFLDMMDMNMETRHKCVKERILGHKALLAMSCIKAWEEVAPARR